MAKEFVTLKIDSETKRLLLRIAKGLEALAPAKPADSLSGDVRSAAGKSHRFREIPLEEVTRYE